MINSLDDPVYLFTDEYTVITLDPPNIHKIIDREMTMKLDRQMEFNGNRA